MRIALIEQAVLNPKCLPRELRRWRNYRIEYGGHAEACLIEGLIWLPPEVEPERIENVLNALFNQRHK